MYGLGNQDDLGYLDTHVVAEHFAAQGPGHSVLLQVEGSTTAVVAVCV